MTANTLLDRAVEALNANAIERAMALITEAARHGDPIRDLQHVRALCLISRGDLPAARQALEAELASFPDNPEAKEILGQVINEQKNGVNGGPGAVDPNAVYVSLNQAVELLKSGKPIEAMRLADEAAKSGVFVPGMHYLHVVCLNIVGRHEEALEAARAELAANPGHQDARIELHRLTQALKRAKPAPLHPEQRSYSSALDRAAMKSIQNAGHNFSYRGVPMIKNPFDYALYPLLLWKHKPGTIIEIGSKSGGSALWFGDTCDNFRLDCHVYSIDIVRVDSVSHPRVTFLEGNGRDLGSVLTPEFLKSVKRPLLVIEDADHTYETSGAVLKFFHEHLAPSDYIVIEDGIISDLENDAACNSGPHRAIKEHVALHPGEYEIDQDLADFFGYNFTWCSNGFLRKKPYALNQSIEKSAIREFNEDDPAGRGQESQMSINERFQLYHVVRKYLAGRPELSFIEIGSHAGASLALQYNALKRISPRVEGYSIEPNGEPGFYEILPKLPEIKHIKAFSGQAVSQLPPGKQFDLIMVDGDHTYQGVKEDILNYYPILKPGGLMVFHDFLPALDDRNRDAIFYHHGGKEPGIRQACLELMEKEYRCQPIELPLIYPDDPTQTQAHLPVIPGVFSTIRAYRKPA